MKIPRISLLIILLLAFAASAGAGKADDVIDAVRKAVAPDKRQVVFDIRYEARDGKPGILSGSTSEASALAFVIDALTRAGIEVENRVRLYPDDRFGLVSIPVASLRTRPAHAGEMATQAVMGTPLRIMDSVSGWLYVQTPDGYIAYVPDSSVAVLSENETGAWRRNDRRMVADNLWQSRIFATPDASGPREVVSDLVLGAIVVADTVAPQSGRIAVILPDGRRGWAAESDLVPVAEWADQPFDADKILDTAYSMEGAPYLWGGTSVKSPDCSGLVKVCYLNNGLILRRDASQQAVTGKRLSASDWPRYQAGDLLFFGSANGRVTHVGIYDHDGLYVHSSGRVKRNSLDPASPYYLYSPLHAVRIDGCQGTDGITRAISHPWYFAR